MSFRVAINGFGRIGQCVLRALYEGEYRDELEVVAINELSDLDTIAYLTQYDTTHGRFPGSVATHDEHLVVNGDRIKVLRCEDPADLPWKALKVDVVLECTGVISDRETAERHIQSGAKKVLFSQPADSAVDHTIVYGVNHQLLRADDRIVSNASCTTNCIVPIIQVLHEAFGVEQGTITTIHSAMNDQPVIDAYHNRDLRRTRSAMHNIVPVNTALAKGIERLLPALAGRFTATAIRVPTINVSAMDMALNLSKTVSVSALNQVLSEAAETKFNNILSFTSRPLASSDFNHDAHSAIVDGSQTRESGGLVKVLAWFDNEWGFANRMLDVSRYWLTLNQ